MKATWFTLAVRAVDALEAIRDTLDDIGVSLSMIVEKTAADAANTGDGKQTQKETETN